MKSISRQTCYEIKVNSYLRYHDYCKSERQQEVSKENEYKDKPELRRRSQEIKNPQNNSLYTQEQPIRPLLDPYLSSYEFNFKVHISVHSEA